MKRSEVAKIAKAHSESACNRIMFRNRTQFDDPFKRLAAAVILQAAIDKLRGEGNRSYWYYGQKVSMSDEMSEDDYRFYADIAGIEYSFQELLRSVKNKNPKLGGKVVRDAAELLIIQEERK